MDSMYTNVELDERVKELRKLEQAQKNIEERIEQIKNDIKSEMTLREVEELKGDDWTVTWKEVVSNRFDQSAFKAMHSDLYESFKVASSSRRFIVK